MKYSLTSVDNNFLWPTVEGVFNEKLKGVEPREFSFDYWLFKIASLVRRQDLIKLDNATFNAALEFTSVYAVASLESSEAGIEEHAFMTQAEYDAEHWRFVIRGKAFSKSWDEARGLLQTWYDSMPVELEEYIKRGWVTKAPKTEDEFIKWAVFPTQDPEPFRKSYRINQDLRKAYKDLLKAALPYIKKAGNVKKAEQLYKDFYNFTALEWLIVLPM